MASAEFAKRVLKVKPIFTFSNEGQNIPDKYPKK